MAGACVFAVLASVVITRASSQSALWNAAFAAILALAAAAATLISMSIASRIALRR